MAEHPVSRKEQGRTYLGVVLYQKRQRGEEGLAKYLYSLVKLRNPLISKLIQI
jgi:hypothetical protein